MKHFIRTVSAYFLMIMLVLPSPAILYAIQELPMDDSEITISMDFKDAELKDVLKVFSIQSGMNFVASEGVQDRKITLYFDKVPLKDAMDKIFKANNLTYELDKDSNIFYVKDWGKPSIETVTKVFFLKYATVSSSSIKEEMKNTISGGLEEPESSSSSSTSSSSTSASGGESGKWKTEEDAGITKAVKKLLTENGSIIEDYRTNSLIVTDIPSRMTIITQVITALDIPIAQVMIEVEMLDVSKNTVDQLGVKWPSTLANLDMTQFGRATSLGFEGNKGFGTTGQTLTGQLGAAASNWVLGAAWPAGHFGPAIFSLGNGNIALQFLRTQTDTRYLARPKILTMNNETAEVKIATQEAIGIKTTTEASSGTTSSEAERFETGVILRVTPQVNIDTGEITMFITPVVSQATAGNTLLSAGFANTFRDPEVRSTKSMVRVKDGDTVVIGGLIRHEKIETVTKLPVLGDIPFVGNLFKHKDKTRDIERELLVFITPRIIRDRNNVTELAQNKNMRVPEREQVSSSSGLDRSSAISNSLNKFEQYGK